VNRERKEKRDFDSRILSVPRYELTPEKNAECHMLDLERRTLNLER
jgi:hypothetical protein